MVDESRKEYDEAAAEASVTLEPQLSVPQPAESVVFYMAQMAELVTPWGLRPKTRDRELRAFIPTEYFLLSALGSVCARNASFNWKLEGRTSPKTVEAMQDLLLNAQFGRGWEDFIVKLSMDLYTQDCGAFIEIIRDGKTEKDPVIGIAVLDAARCWLTGDPEKPVIYQQSSGKWKELNWWQVYNMQEMPSPQVMGARGVHYTIQYCAVSRLLKAAQILKNITTYKEEKTGGRFQKAIHLVTGVNADQLKAALAERMEIADAKGLTRYVQPTIVTAIDPNSPVGHDTIELASLPDGFDEDSSLRNYITILAMAFLVDYQDFAPLPGGNLGTSMQSQVLHMKSRGKGPALFHKLIGHMLNMSILPKTVEFSWDEQDIEYEAQAANVAKTRAEERKLRVDTGEITGEGARQIALDAGDLPQELFDAMGAQDVTPSVVVRDVEKFITAPGEPKVTLEAPSGPPQAQTQVPAAQGKVPPASAPGSPVPAQEVPPEKSTVGGKADEPEEVSPERLALEEEVTGQIEDVFARVRKRVQARMRGEMNDG